MTQIALHSFDIISRIKGGNCKTVAKIMKSGIVRDFCQLNNLLEMLHNRTSDKIFSKCIRKHKVEMIVPQIAGKCFLGLLLLQFFAECILTSKMINMVEFLSVPAMLLTVSPYVSPYGGN